MVGWIAYWILRLKASTLVLSELLTLLGVLGGAAVIALFNKDGTLFGWYSVGLVVGFFAYFAVGFMLYGKQEMQLWRIEQQSKLNKRRDFTPRTSSQIFAT